MELSTITIDNIIIKNNDDRAQYNLLKKVLDMGYYAYSPIWLKKTEEPKGKMVIVSGIWRGKFSPDGKLVEIFPDDKDFMEIEIANPWVIAVGLEERIPGTKIWEEVNGLYLIGKIENFWMYSNSDYFPFYGAQVLDKIGVNMVTRFERPLGFIATRTQRKRFLFVRYPKGDGRIEKLVRFYINNPSSRDVKIRTFKSRGKRREWIVSEGIFDISGDRVKWQSNRILSRVQL